MVDNPNKTRTYRAGKAFTSDGTYINIYDLFFELQQLIMSWEANGIPIDDREPIETLEQDNTNAPFIANINQVIVRTTTASIATKDTFTVDITDITGFLVGDSLVIGDILADRFYFGSILDITVNTITMDTPFDYTFPSGSPCSTRSTNMAVDGSITPQTFSVRGEGSEQIPTVFDISRIIITCLTDTACSLIEFGDIPKLLRGLVMRRVNGDTNNIFNVKSNQDLANLAFDFDIYASTNPVQGQDGFTCRLTFNGQSKMGVAIRIGPGEDIEFIVQDDLTDINNLSIIVEGHIVDVGYTGY